MKTVYFFFSLIYSINLIAQIGLDYSRYPIIITGEELIESSQADSSFRWSNELLNKTEATSLMYNQALFIAGKSLFHLGKKDDALIPIQKSVAIAQKSNDNLILLKSLIVLSAILIEKEEPALDSALLILDNAKDLAEIQKDTQNLAKIYINKSSTLYNLGEFKEALDINIDCENLLKNTNLNKEKALNFQGKGNNLMEMYIFEEKKEHLINCQKSYWEALRFFQDLKDSINIAHIKNSIGATYLHSNDLDKAAEEIKESIDIGINKKDSSLLVNGYYNLCSVYEMKGDMPHAIDALKKLKPILNKFGSSEDKRYIIDQFSKGEKVLSNVLIENLISIYEERLKGENVTRLLASVASIFLGIAITLFFYFRQQRKLAAKKHQLLLEELESTLKTQEINYTRAKLEGAEESRQRIVRKIHDGVGGLLINTRWSLESTLIGLPKAQQNVAEQLYENLKLQEKSYLELRRAMHELEREDTDWWDDLRQLYEKIGAEYATKIRFYTYNLGENAKGKVGEEARMVVQEIITNAIKHAKAREINIQINNIEEVLVIIIQDDGIGFDPQQTQEGMGLRNLKERIQKLGGTFDIDSGRGAGATFFIDIPLPTPENLKENPLLYGVN